MITKSQSRVAHNRPRFIYDVVSDIAGRDAIPSNIRFEGMEVITSDTGGKYRLVGGITNAEWVFVSSGGGIFLKQRDLFTINATDATNGYLDLSQTPIATEHIVVEKNGQMLAPGISNDYTISGNRVTFLSPISIQGVPDQISVFYSYL